MVLLQVSVVSGYHWDLSDLNQNPHWSRGNDAPRKRRATTLPRHSHSLRNPDNQITIDPEKDYSCTDLHDELESDVLEDDTDLDDIGSETGDDLDDADALPDYRDMLEAGIEKYLPAHSDVGDSNWGSQSNALNADFDDSVNNLTDAGELRYGFSLPRHRHKPASRANATNRYSGGDFNTDYSQATGAIALDDLSVVPYPSAGSLGNVCEIDDSEANLSDSDSSNASMRLVKSNKNLHTVV